MGRKPIPKFCECCKTNEIPRSSRAIYCKNCGIFIDSNISKRISHLQYGLKKLGDIIEGIKK